MIFGSILDAFLVDFWGSKGNKSEHVETAKTIENLKENIRFHSPAVRAREIDQHQQTIIKNQ